MKYSGDQNKSDIVCFINIVGKFFSAIINEQKIKNQRNRNSELFILDVDKLISIYCKDNNLLFHSMRDIHYNLN